MSTHPKPPSGTKAAGRRLWCSIVDDYDLDEHELVLLREAVRTVDLLADLDVIVKREGPLVDSPQGVRAHPAVVEGPSAADRAGQGAGRAAPALRGRGRPAVQCPPAAPWWCSRGLRHPGGAVRRKERRPTLADPPPGVGIPPELRQPNAAVWHDQSTYHRYMRKHGWTMPVRERMNVEATPGSRRRAAVAGWALASGITITVVYGQNSQSRPDWGQLGAWGLAD